MCIRKRERERSIIRTVVYRLLFINHALYVYMHIFGDKKKKVKFLCKHFLKLYSTCIRSYDYGEKRKQQKLQNDITVKHLNRLRVKLVGLEGADEMVLDGCLTEAKKIYLYSYRILCANSEI